ncbi:MAG: tetratricopeptide repeat protein [Phycisphaerales bacterium]|nr:tetratricopeptide repeat protein [Phycisphaerales bacterium]
MMTSREIRAAGRKARPMGARAAVAVSLAWMLVVGCQTPPHHRQRDEAEKNLNRFRGQAKFRIAQQAVQRWQVDEAESALREAVTLAPDEPLYYRSLASCLLEKGEIAAAAAACDKAETLGDQSAALAYVRGMIAQRGGRDDDALGQYQLAMERDGNNADYIVAVVESLVAADRVDDAWALLDERILALDLNPKLLLQRAHLAVLLGRNEQAANDFAAVGDLIDTTPWHREQYGRALMRSGRHADAARVLEPIVQSSNAAEITEQVVSSSAVNGYVTCVMRAGDLPTAESKLRAHLDRIADDADGWRLLCEIRLRRGDYPGALAAARSGSGVAPMRPDWTLVQAYVDWRRGDAARAVEVLNALLARHPRQVEAMCLLGDIQSGRGDAAAGKWYESALQIDPKSEWARARIGNGSESDSPPSG